MYMRAPTFRFQNRFLKFNAFSPTMRRAPTGWKKPGGVTGLPAHIAAVWVSLSGLQTALWSYAVAPVARIRASLPGR
jgi:hypothetical protein